MFMNKRGIIEKNSEKIEVNVPETDIWIATEFDNLRVGDVFRFVYEDAHAYSQAEEVLCQPYYNELLRRTVVDVRSVD